MARMTGADLLKKYKKNLGNSIEDIKRGVTNTDKDQAANAIKAIPKMKAKVIEAIDNGKVERGLQKSGRKGWETGMLTKGVNNIVPGITAKEGKILDTMNKVAEIGNATREATMDMPNNNLEEGLNKVRVVAEMNKEFWKNQ